MKPFKLPIRPYLIGGAAIWLLQMAIMVLSVDYWIDSERQLHLEKELSVYKTGIDSLIGTFGTRADTTFDNAINRPEIGRLMYEAVHADTAERDEVRKQLYTSLYPLYQNLRTQHLRQLHFHLPGSISFLRFHSPGQYGDSLQGVRITVDTVNRTHTKVSGFEEGRVNNGFRHVYPLFYHNEFVGTVEISYSFDAVKEIAENLYGTYCDLIIKKEIVDKTVFKNKHNNYAVTDFSASYYYDRRLSVQKQSGYSDALLRKINALLRSELHTAPPSATLSTVYTLPLQTDIYTVFFIPIRCFENTHIGYILIYRIDKELPVLKAHFWQMFWISILLITLITWIIVRLYYRIRLQQEALRHMAYTDTLTKIGNRTYINEQLEYLCALANRQGRPLSIIFFDIDHFKNINDELGHQTGDRVLSELSEIIVLRIRKSDVFGRWGGEEFILGLPDTTLEEALNLAESYRRLVEHHAFACGTLTASFGVVELKPDESFTSVLQRADKMLYNAKNDGRNRICS